MRNTLKPASGERIYATHECITRVDNAFNPSCLFAKGIQRVQRGLHLYF